MSELKLNENDSTKLLTATYRNNSSELFKIQYLVINNQVKDY